MLEYTVSGNKHASHIAIELTRLGFLIKTAATIRDYKD